MRRFDFNGMWDEALSMLEQAERLQRQFAHFGRGEALVARGRAAEAGPKWEPPVDIVETADALTVQVALPGVSADSVNVVLEDGAITVTASRAFAAGDRGVRVHRLEIPFGRFARRVVLPPGIAARALELVGRNFADGCLILTFRKLEAA